MKDPLKHDFQIVHILNEDGSILQEILFPVEVIAKLKVVAKAEGLSLDQYYRRLLYRYFESK